MLPIRDNNPTSSTPYVTISLIVLNSLIFLYEVSRPGDGMNRLTFKYGYVPAELVRGSEEVARDMRAAEHNAPWQLARDPRTGRSVLIPPQRLPVAEVTAVPAWINLITCMFLHGGWMHLIGNMLFLWIFGNNIEDRLGWGLFLIFYLGTGIVGSLAHTFFEPGFSPLVGASGAISGVMGAYIVLYPRARILGIIPIGWYPLTVSLPAWVYLGFYFLIQNLYPAYFTAAHLTGGQGGIARWAHIGGFASGAALILLFPRKPRPPVARPAYDPAKDNADIVI
jgi:membrane associated rhomboid family serine protease